MPKNPWLRIVLILAFFAAPAVLAISLPRIYEGEFEEQPAPNFEAHLLDGPQVRLSDYTGKIVILNFWATWCAPCVIEMPLLQEIHDQGDVVVLAVNNGESPQQIRTFLEKHDISLPIVLDTDRQLQKGFNVPGYPTTMFISPGGYIEDVHSGILTNDIISEVIEHIAPHESFLGT